LYTFPPCKIKIMSKYYAVCVGRKPGIYLTWDECLKQVNKYPGAQYKKFNSYEAAQEFIINFEKRKQNINKKKQTMLLNDLTITKDRIVVFTDGTCELNGSFEAKAGIGIYWPNSEYENLSELLPGKIQTNNRAEIYAIIRAIEMCLDKEKMLEIKTDSMYVVNAYNLWISKWIENDWKRDNGKPVLNRDLFERMIKLIDSRKRILITYVKGHSGIHGNIEADRLARKSL
jgi:ribonuclease HI